MSEPFIAQISLFAGNFAPRSWAFCDGQYLAIADNTALYSLIGTTYGGDGRTTTALPDLRGRMPLHPGNGPGLTPRNLGERSGVETVVLSTTQIPPHNHAMQGNSAAGDSPDPSGRYPALPEVEGRPVAAYAATTNGSMGTTANQGGGQGHDNMPPYLGINFIIALQGLYPSRN